MDGSGMSNVTSLKGAREYLERFCHGVENADAKKLRDLCNNGEEMVDAVFAVAGEAMRQSLQTDTGRQDISDGVVYDALKCVSCGGDYSTALNAVFLRLRNTPLPRKRK